MEKIILFGAGEYGKRAITLLGKENIDFFIDNNEEKWGKTFLEYPIYSLDAAKKIIVNQKIVISVSSKYEDKIAQQLEENGINGYEKISDIQIRITKEKIQKRIDYIGIYKKAIEWIHRNTIEGKGIITNTDLMKPYPEVTGYYIPTLIRWGYKDLAVSYAKWLCEIQKPDGSWYDTHDEAPYVFDSAQILKGLLTVREIYPSVDENIKKGCDWILGNINEDGRLTTPTQRAWGNDNSCSELIHMYCLSPLVEAGNVFDIPRYKDATHKVLNYYKKEYYNDIMNFRLLSHFYAYVMEALLDMNEREMATEAMEKVATLQKANGAVPAYQNVDWVCSTGLFQFALVWFRLGEVEKGNKAFEYACKLQNESGGWFGSYLSEENPMEDNNYFPREEISWAIKYFLDALYYRSVAEFNVCADMFSEEIDKKDGRYLEIKSHVKEVSNKTEGRAKILDVGCGKGRYLKNLISEEPENQYYAVDLSERVMESIKNENIIKCQGTLTNIPYPNDTFSLTYTCEALEHAVDISSAVREMVRVTKKGGKIVVIDKNDMHLGYMQIGEYEQWFAEAELADILAQYCTNVEVKTGISYDMDEVQDLFSAWIGIVK